MASVTMTARPITAKTKGEMKELRRQGSIPVTLQHKGDTTLHLEVKAVAVDKAMATYGESAVFDLLIEPDNTQARAMIHEVQRDPVTRVIIQATFQKMNVGDTVKTHVPLRVHGEPASIKDGTNVIMYAAESIEVKCAQDKLPDHIMVEISHLAAFGAVRIADLPKMDGVQILMPEETVIVSLGALSKVEAAPVVAPSAAPAAPSA
ncbi:MAG: 50S ribosomal protein L25 [Chthonomonadaceae bacterium]|nr:50S ribosomal protein L25 [Chthonomonadaceae bacterium]